MHPDGAVINVFAREVRVQEFDVHWCKPNDGMANRKLAVW